MKDPMFTQGVPAPVIRPEWLAGITMTQAQKDAWLQALRSGTYHQGESALAGKANYEDSDDEWERDERYEYCCLGVAARVCLNEQMKNLLGNSELEEIGHQSFLGPWSASAEDPSFSNTRADSHTTIQRVLAAMNDSGKSFLEIADFIEKHIPACDAAKATEGAAA